MMDQPVEPWEHEVDPEPFGSRTACRACGAPRLGCRIQYREIPVDVPIGLDSLLDWLLVTCGRCGYQWTEYTADTATGRAERSERRTLPPAGDRGSDPTVKGG